MTTLANQGSRRIRKDAARRPILQPYTGIDAWLNPPASLVQSEAFNVDSRLMK